MDYDAQESKVTWTGLFALLGVLFVPVLLVAGYGVQQAHQADARASEALLAANRARPDPFTGTQGAALETKMTNQMQLLEQRCGENYRRLDRAMETLEQRCLARIHATQYGRYPSNEEFK